MYLATGISRATQRTICIAVAALIVAIEVFSLSAGAKFAYVRQASASSQASFAYEMKQLQPRG